MTPSGRFETNKKVCLSISSYHPEHWLPSWGLSTILTATATFMTTPGGGAVGAIDATPALRHQLANESTAWSCPVCKLSNKEMFPRAHDLFEKEKAEKMEKDKAKAAANDKSAEEVVSRVEKNEPSATTEPQKEETSVDVTNVETPTPQIVPEIDHHSRAEAVPFEGIAPSQPEEMEQPKQMEYADQTDLQKHDQIENIIETICVPEMTSSDKPVAVEETARTSPLLDSEMSPLSSLEEETAVVERILETVTTFSQSEKVPEHEEIRDPITKQESNSQTVEVRADTLQPTPSSIEQEPSLISASATTSAISSPDVVSQTGLRQRFTNSASPLAGIQYASSSQVIPQPQSSSFHQTTSTVLTTPVAAESDTKASLQMPLVVTTVPHVQPQELRGENGRATSPAGMLTRLLRSLRQQETQLVIVDTSLCMLLAIVFFIFIHSRYFHGTLLNFLNDFS